MITETHLPQVFGLENQNKLLVLQLQFTDQTRHTELHLKRTINFSYAVFWLAFMLILDYNKRIVWHSVLICIWRSIKHLETCWVKHHL
jgi:hypothetical protein